MTDRTCSGRVASAARTEASAGKGVDHRLGDQADALVGPAEAPRVTVAVMVHGAKVDYHGSMLAAPIYKKIAVSLLSDWAAAPVNSSQ